MEALLNKYVNKLVVQTLCDKEEILFGGLDAELFWNRTSQHTGLLEKVVAGLSINSILFSPPKEPYFSIINYLANHARMDDDAIHPGDTETRTFLHDIPVVNSFDADLIIAQLKRRKAVVVKDVGIVTFGIVSPEQAFIVYSSVCFSCFVKFFTDYYCDARVSVQINPDRKKILEDGLHSYGEMINRCTDVPVFSAPFRSSEEILHAICEGGRLTVKSGMVDSFFGNISLKSGDTIYISQTGSSLDELEGLIDPCPIDGRTSTAITASSEFAAHRNSYMMSTFRAILHGHPRFSVILSMICEQRDCTNRGRCHTHCSRDRRIQDIPIVPGEVGNGPTGLVHTLPSALAQNRGVILYGHGLFTSGKVDFSDAFQNMLSIEKMCLEEYKKKV